MYARRAINREAWVGVERRRTSSAASVDGREMPGRGPGPLHDEHWLLCRGISASRKGETRRAERRVNDTRTTLERAFWKAKGKENGSFLCTWACVSEPRCPATVDGLPRPIHA